MKSTLLPGLAVLISLGVAPAPAGTEEAPPGLEKSSPNTPLGWGDDRRDEQASEAQGVVKDEATEVPNTGGVTAGNEEDVDSRVAGETDRQEAITPERSDGNAGGNGERLAAPERE